MFENLWKEMKTELGFGVLRLPQRFGRKEIDYEKVCRMVDIYMRSDRLHYFEVAYNYFDGQVEGVIRKALVERYDRGSFLLTDKMPLSIIHSKSDYKKIFEEQLCRCGVTYFDGYLLHNLSDVCYRKTVSNGGFEFLKYLKETGKASFIGFSFHDSAEVLEKILSENSFVDVVQLQINYLDWESATIQSKECYKVAKKFGKPIIVMEALKAGTLAKYPYGVGTELKEKVKEEYLPELAMKFVASLENVKIVLSGVSNEQQVSQNLKIIEKSGKILNENNGQLYKKLIREYQKNFLIPCTACNYCLEVCPKKIQISHIFELYNYVSNYPRQETLLTSQYGKNYTGMGSALDCIECGKCERICSQHLKIRESLKLAATLFPKDRANRLNEIRQGVRYVIYGAGKMGRAGAEFVRKKGGKIVCYCDADKNKQGSYVDDIEIKPIEYLVMCRKNYDKILIFNAFTYEIVRQLLDMGIDINIILAPQLPAEK